MSKENLGNYSRAQLIVFSDFTQLFQMTNKQLSVGVFSTTLRNYFIELRANNLEAINQTL